MSDRDQPVSLEEQLRLSLCRLARFGANITDSHSCFIFLPPAFLNRRDAANDELLIGGYHSLCSDILATCSIRNGTGLIGWVGRHAQPIHVSPFEHDSRTLGMYRDDRQLKSFIGIPIALKKTTRDQPSATGVIACDSKKSFAFSKLQGKLLANLADEVSHTVALLISQSSSDPFPSWDEFLSLANEAITALGPQSVDVLRLRIRNFTTLERELGSADCIELCQQLFRLLAQSLPPHFPHYQLPNGDFVVVMDNMMSSFYENRIVALAEHIRKEKPRIELSFNRSALYSRRRGDASIEAAIRETIFVEKESMETGDTEYEHRRA